MVRVETAREMLAAAGLPVSGDELAQVDRAYAAQRPLVDLLYAVQAARYVDPVLVMTADAPTVTDWAAD